MSMTEDVRAAYERAKPDLARRAPLDQWKPQLDVEHGAYRLTAVPMEGEPVILIPWKPIGQEVT